jgi:hypothetical protein
LVSVDFTDRLQDSILSSVEALVALSFTDFVDLDWSLASGSH